MASVVRVLLGIVGSVLGVALETLYFVYPEATRAFVARALGVSDATMVSLIVLAMAVFGVMMFIAIGIIILVQWRRKKEQTGKGESKDHPVALAHACIANELGTNVRIVEWKSNIDEVEDRIFVFGVGVDDKGHLHAYAVGMTKDHKIFYVFRKIF